MSRGIEKKLILFQSEAEEESKKICGAVSAEEIRPNFCSAVLLSVAVPVAITEGNCVYIGAKRKKGATST